MQVAAGDDAYHMGDGGALAIGGLSVGAASDLSLINNTTQAYIGGHVTAAQNVYVLAVGEEDIVAVADAASSGDAITVTPSFPVISLQTATHAFVDANAYVHASGSVLVDSTDNTSTTALAGGAGVGSYVGVGASASVTLITKDTEAYIGQGAQVLADGGASISGVFDGTTGSGGAFNTGTIQGLGVEASSSEQVLSIAASGTASFGVGFTGALGFYIPKSNTAAYINTGATVNAYQVNVSAANNLRTFGVAANLQEAAGLGVAGAFDVGLVRNNTTATIGGNVTAVKDVDVYALSQIEGDSFIGGVGYGASGLVATDALYSIRHDFSKIFNQDLLGFLTDGSTLSLQATLDAQIAQLANPASTGIAGLLNAYAAGIAGGNATANAINVATPLNPAETAVTATLGNIGTQAHISGGTVVAGGNVVVSGKETDIVHLDSSFNFTFSGGSPLLLNDDRSILASGGQAGGFIDSGANVIANGAISVLGDVSNSQLLSADTVVNGAANTVTAAIDGSTATAKGGAVNVLATSENQLTFSALLPAYNKAVQDKSDTSTIGGTIEARITGNSTVTASTSVNVDATQTGTISSIEDASDLITKGKLFQVAAALLTNKTNATVSAHIDNSTVLAQGGDVNVNAGSGLTVKSIGVGGAVDAGSANYAGAGSYIATDIDDTISAYTTGANIRASGNVNVTAADSAGGINTSVLTLSGAAAVNMNAYALGAAVTDNKLEDIVTASISGGTILALAGGVSVTASSKPTLNTTALALSGANKYSLGGSVTINQVDDTAGASVTGGAQVTAQGSVLVGATDTPVLFVAAGGVGASNSVAAGAAVAIDKIASNVTANVNGSTVIANTGNVQVLADRDADLTHVVVVGGGVGGTVGVAGSVDDNTFSSTSQASVTGSSTVTAYDNVEVLAQGENDVSPLIGTVTVGGSAGIGGSLLLNEYSDNTNAFLEASTVTAAGNAPLSVPLADGSGATTNASGVAVIATTTNNLNVVK